MLYTAWITAAPFLQPGRLASGTINIYLCCFRQKCWTKTPRWTARKLRDLGEIKVSKVHSAHLALRYDIFNKLTEIYIGRKNRITNLPTVADEANDAAEDDDPLEDGGDLLYLTILTCRSSTGTFKFLNKQVRMAV